MEDRKNRLEKDIKQITLWCQAWSIMQVREITNESLNLILQIPQCESTEYIFNIGPDYPDGTVVCTADGSVVLPKRDPLPSVVIDICEGWCRKNNVSFPDFLVQAGVSAPHPTSISAQLSVASSEYTETSEGDIDDDSFDDYDYNEEDGGEGINPVLEHEIQRVVEVYGCNSIETRIHAGIDEMDVFFNIDLNNYLDEHTASAWGVDLNQPLVILLHIRSVSKYLDGVEPQVDVFQAPPDCKADKKKVGLGSQVKKIVQTFVSNQWKQLSNLKMEEMLKKTTTSTTSSQIDTSTGDTQKDRTLSHLLEMGFGHQQSVEALQATNYDLADATAILAQQSADYGLSSTPTMDTVDFMEDSSKELEPATKRKDGSFFKLFSRQVSLGAQMESPEEDDSDDPMVDKRVPSLEDGFLAQCMQYSLNRIRSLNEFCVICDERHVLETGLIKPCVCTRELCVFAFQTLGVMADAAEAIATDADVVDLLIAMANAATYSSRVNLILDPYPSIVDPDNPLRLAMDPKSKNFDLVKQVLSKVVEYREELLVRLDLAFLQRHSSTLNVCCERGRASNMKQQLDAHNKLCFPLMQWIIATCRAHIVLLPQNRQLKSMQTKYQFILISSPPSKEAVFQQAKAKHGSVFAFHGSNIENWHSIMRKGLINASGTKYQLHGAAYGKGIYLSPLSSVSFGYTGYGRQPGKPKPRASERECLAGKVNLRCLALCEVVTTKDLKRSGNIWVCPNSDHVCTRFFFVYDDSSDRGQGASDSIDTRIAKFKGEIDHAVAHIRSFKKPPSKKKK